MKKVYKSFLIILGLSSILFIFSCAKQDEVTEMPISGKIPDEQADSIKVLSTSNNVIDYELTAVHYYKYYSTKQTFADTVYVTFFNTDGSVKSTLKCNKAEVNDANNSLTGIGDVVVVSDNGIMKAPLMVLDRNSNTLYAKQGVSLQRENNLLIGEEMESNLDLDRVEITKVSAQGKLEDEKINW
ncbi:MAG: LPS export ABC transporter periplasmic protein LptC [Candidatus Tenebribacter mawsonii]|nr:LPS export ABC transporter periplasmic protein LptC [Candidatus Tenebribacter mawsonii]